MIRSFLSWLLGQRRWDYMVLPMTSADDQVEPDLVDHKVMISALGNSGWEMVAVYKDQIVFKKPC